MSHPLRSPSKGSLILRALLLCILFAGSSVVLQAQTTITIGNGTASSYQYPLNMYYWHSITEAIYTSSEISTAGWTSGSSVLTHVGWNVATAAGWAPLAGSYIQIYMMNTTATTLAGGTPPTTGTLVYQGPHPLFNTTGWWMFGLNTPFCYSGSNLYLRVVRYDYGYGSPYAYFYYTTGTSNQATYGYADVNPPTTLYTSTNKPNIRMTMVAPGTPAYASSTATQTNTSVVGTGATNQEIIGMTVVTSGGCTGTPVSATAFTLNTAGSTSASNISAAKVFYTGGSSSFAATNQFGSTVTNPSGSFTVNGTQALTPGTNYFWLAYDISASAPSGNVVDGQFTSITANGSTYSPTVSSPAGSRTILASFSGIYTIDPNGTGSRNYTSFTNAINALQAAGVSGATTFQVAAATYNEQIVIPPIPGASATNTITFDGGTGNAASRIISYSVNTAYQSVVTLNGADYTKWKNLTINSTNGTYGYCVLFTAQADYNEISNCVLNTPANTTSSYHLTIVASSTGSFTASGNWANYNLIKDNELNGGYYSVSWWGSSASSLTTNVGNQFIGNTIQDFYYMGMYLYYTVGIKVHNNRIICRSSGTGYYGIYGYYFNDGPEFIGNYINVHYYAFYNYYPNYYVSSTSNRAKYINNMVIADGTSTTYGIYTPYPSYADYFYNTVYTKTTGTSYGLYTYGYGSSSYNVKIANNYITHDGNGTWYATYQYYSADVTQMDYNAFYRFGTTGTTYFYWNSTGYTSLAALQSATTGYHDNSVWGPPYFISGTDLHSRSHVGYQAGTPIPGVTNDYDGDTRSATVPSIGCDEYPQPPNEKDMEMIAVRFENAANKFSHQEDPATHVVKASIQNIGLSANPTSLDVVYKQGSMPANATDGVAQTFTPSWDANNKTVVTFTQPISGLSEGSTETVYARVFFPGEEDATNDTKMNTHTIFGSKVHGWEDFEDMVPGVLPLTYDEGYLPAGWKVVDNNGGTTLRIVNFPGQFGGTNQAITQYSTGDQSNEWLFSPGAFLIAGSSYRVGFEFRNWGGSPVTIECAFGDSPNPSAMTTYATFANIAPGGFLTAKDLAGGIDPYFNTPNVHQLYYLGFRFTTSATNPYFSIDKIKLDDNPSPPPKIAYGLPGDPIDNFIDDPAVPIIMIANYKVPGMINKTFAVANKINIYGAAGDFLWDVETSTPWLSITKAIPDPTLQNYNLNPPRPRQFQTFTLSADPTGLAPGVHMGAITFYAILFNNDFPPPANGLIATNEPMVVPVELRITTAGSKGGAVTQVATVAGPLTVPGSPYYFVDPQSGDPIATLQVTSGQIGSMTITCYPNQLPQNITRMLYVQRYWQIAYTGTGWTANITFPYADHEASMILDRYQLRGVRQAVPLGAWENPIMGTTSTSYPLINAVQVQNLNPSNIGGNIALAQPYMVVTKDAAPVADFGLEQNYPNPFNPTTSIRYAVAEERPVRIAVYNSLGAEVAVLVDDVLPAGRYEASFDARNLPSGTYVYRMTAGDFIQTRQMTLSK